MSFAGIVLAGGRSSRMGRDKALLVHRGRSLIENAMAVLREAGAMPVLLSGDRPGGIADPVRGLGPIAGIAGCLPALRDGLVVIVPVDMPRVDAALLRRLVDAARLVRSATFDGHPLPWAFHVDAGSRRMVGTVLACEGRDRSLRALQARLGTATLAIPQGAEERLENVNTPSDWERLAR